MIPTEQIEEKILMSIITNELEDYDENREPSRWKINLEKLKAFIHTIREEDRKEMENLPEMQDEDVFRPDDYEIIARNELRARIRKSLEITNE